MMKSKKIDKLWELIIFLLLALTDIGVRPHELSDVRYRLLLLRINASPYRNCRKLRCSSGTHRYRYGSLP